MAHSVSGHLKLRVAEYDELIRRLVPAFPAMRPVQLDLLAQDYYPSLITELRLLADAGFAEPECFWREAAAVVFGAVKTSG